MYHVLQLMSQKNRKDAVSLCTHLEVLQAQDLVSCQSRAGVQPGDVSSNRLQSLSITSAQMQEFESLSPPF